MLRKQLVSSLKFDWQVCVCVWDGGGEGLKKKKRERGSEREYVCVCVCVCVRVCVYTCIIVSLLLITDHFYTALFSALKQTHWAHVTCDSE